MKFIKLFILLNFAIFFYNSALCYPSGLKLDERWSISGSLRTRYEFWNWFEPGNSKNNDYGYGATTLRFGIGYRTEFIDAFLQAQDTRIFNLPSNAIDAPPRGPLGAGAIYFAHHRRREQGRTFIKQGYLNFQNIFIHGISFKLGRFDYLGGLECLTGDKTLDWLKKIRISQRLIGPFGWSHVTRSFDGIQAAYDSDKFNLTALYSHLTQGGFEIGANEEISKIDLSSISLTLKKKVFNRDMEGRIFYIYYKDDRNILKVDNRKKELREMDKEDIKLSTLGFHLINTYSLSSGKVDTLLWGAYQMGDWGVLDHRAFAIDGEIGYQFSNIYFKPWLRLGFFYGSGDNDPRDDDHNTFFQLLPTARLYALFPFYNLMNNKDLFIQLLLRPKNNLLVRMDLHELKLAERGDLVYMGAGPTKRGGKIFGYIGKSSFNERDIAKVFEIVANYNINKNLNLNGYFGHAFGDEVIKRIYSGEDADFGYIEMNIRF